MFQKKRHKITPKILFQCVCEHPCQRPSILTLPPPNPRSLGFLQHLAICSVAPSRRCHSSNGCDLLEYNTNAAHPSGAKYLGKKVEKTRTPEDVPTKKSNRGNHEMLPKTKINETLSKDPLISLYVSIFLLHTVKPNRVSLFFLGKESTAPNIEPPPPLQPPTSASHLVDHREATLHHHPIVRPPWSHRFETWRHTPGSDRIG